MPTRSTRIHKQILSVTFRISRHPEGTFGEKIRKFRLERGLRQLDPAIMLGVNETTIVNRELDRRPTRRYIERLGRLTRLGV
jgi:DNA-binding XRE family transcriptional regulator